MTDKSIRIEQALRFWEDACFRASRFLPAFKEEGHNLPCPIMGPLVNYQRFRKYLLENRNPWFNINSFFNPQEVVSYLGEMSWVPLGIFSWNFDSRRVFHLTHNLQTLLSATRLDITASDEIHLPFDSFSVTLADPIMDKKGNRFDCILFSSISKHVEGLKPHQFLLNLFCEDLSSVRPLGMIEKERISKGIRNRDQKILACLQEDSATRLSIKAADYAISEIRALKGNSEYPTGKLGINELLVRTNVPGVDWNQFQQELKQDLEQSGVENVDEDIYFSSDAIEKAGHLIASLCLYLASLPPKEAAKIAWQRPLKIQGQSEKVITRNSQVCTVSCEHSLTADDRAVLDQISITRQSHAKCVHWRRGYWRRAIGSGHDPEAPRTVWVRPTLVNRTRLPPKSLPIGSQTTLTG